MAPELHLSFMTQIWQALLCQTNMTWKIDAKANLGAQLIGSKTPLKTLTR
jgi:hypothetical protein